MFFYVQCERAEDSVTPLEMFWYRISIVELMLYCGNIIIHLMS